MPSVTSLLKAAIEYCNSANNDVYAPETVKVEPKHIWVVSHDGLVFGSGWYHSHVSEQNWDPTAFL